MVIFRGAFPRKNDLQVSPRILAYCDIMIAVKKLSNPLLILVPLCVGYALSLFQRVYPSVLAPDLMEAFSLDAASFSLISSATMLGYAITQIPSGMLADIFGGRKTLAAYQVLAGTFCIVFTLCDSLMPAVTCRFLIGLTLASNVPSYKILAAAVPAGKYALYSAVITASGTFGSLLAASPIVAAAQLIGWRAALAFVGVFTVFLGAAIWLLIPEYHVHEKSGIDNGSRASIVRQNAADLISGLKAVFRMRTFWLVFAWFMFMIGNHYVLATTWLGSYLMQANGFSKDLAGVCLSVIALLPLPFMLIIPWFSDRIFHSRKLLLIVGAAVQAAVLMVFCLNRTAPLSFVALTALVTTLFTSTGGMTPIAFTMIKESVPSSAMASAIAFINASGPVYAAVMQGVVGAAITRGMVSGQPPLAAYADAFLFLLAGSVIALICSFFMKDTLSPRKKMSAQA